MDDKAMVKLIAEQVMGWRHLDGDEALTSADMWAAVRRLQVSHFFIDFCGKVVVYDFDSNREYHWSPLESIADAFEMENRILKRGQESREYSLVNTYTFALFALLSITPHKPGIPYFELIHATARQRSEAAIRMLAGGAGLAQVKPDAGEAGNGASAQGDSGAGEGIL